MSNKSRVPYGLRSSVECLNRAALLAKQEDIQTFLSGQVEEMLEFSHDDSADPVDVAYRFEEQWGMSACNFYINRFLPKCLTLNMQ